MRIRPIYAIVLGFLASRAGFGSEPDLKSRTFQLTYYFGHHDENRLEFSKGRDLRLVPSQHGPPLNFFVYPYAEVDGRPHEAIDHKFTFADREPL